MQRNISKLLKKAAVSNMKRSSTTSTKSFQAKKSYATRIVAHTGGSLETLKEML